jgi:CRISPR/Cas system-associated endonuclease Cas1
MRLQEIIIASRGISFSSDLIEELCERGIRIAFLNSSGKPLALITSPMLTATVETRRAQLTACQSDRGADLCRWIVAGKLHNQEKLLRYFAKSRDGEKRSALETSAAFAGFLHVERSGKPSLVLDLMEEFRQPVVDRPILSWLNKGGQLVLQKGMLDAASKESVASRVLLRLVAAEQHRGKQHQVRSIIQMQARLAASAVRGLRPYRSYSFKW